MNLKNLIPWNQAKESKEISSSYKDPFYELQRDMNRVFDNFFSDFGNFPSLGTKKNLQSFNPKINISETDKEIKVVAELPCLEEKDIEVNLQDDTLVIKGEKKSQQENKDENYHLIESSYGSFYRSIVLPSGIDKEKIDAHYKNGVMSISIPKTEAAKTNTKKIALRKD